MTRTRERLAIAATIMAAVAVVAFVPDGFLRWTFPKYALLAIAVLVATFGLRTGRAPRWMWWCLGGVLGALVVGAIAGQAATGTDLLAGLFGRWPRYLGPLTGGLVAVGGLWVGATLLNGTARASVRATFVMTLSGAGILVGGLATLETLGVRPIPSDLDRPGSLLGNATDQGIVSAMILVVLLAALPWILLSPRRWQGWLVSAGIVGAGLGLVLSASRGAYLGAGVGLVALVLLAWRTRLVTARVALGAGAVMTAALVAAVFLVPSAASRLLGEDPIAAATAGERWTLWERGWQVFTTSPIVGGGTGSFVDRVSTFHDTEWFTGRARNTVLESSHNWLLDIASDGGIVLVLAVLALIVLTVRSCVRNTTDARSRADHGALVLYTAAPAAAVAAGVALLAHPTGPAVLILLAILAGAVIGEPRTPGSASGAAWRTIALRSGAAIWVLLLVWATVAEVSLRVAHTDALSADERAAAFALASVLRLGDPEVTAIGAQQFAQSVSQGDLAALERADEWTDAAVHRLPASMTALDARAVVLEAQARWSDAVAVREEMARLAPANPIPRLDIAIDLASLGDYAGAVVNAHLALEIDPSLTNAQALIDQVCQLAPVAGCGERAADGE